MDNDQVKPEDAATGADAGTDTSTATESGSAPAANNAGASDASAEQSDTGTDAQPESATADTTSTDAAPQAAVSAPAPAAVAAAPAPATPPVVQNVATVQPSTLISGPTKYEAVNRILAGVPAGKLGFILFLNEYVKEMAPRRPVDPKAGANMQTNLYKQIMALLKNEDQYFREIFAAVLKIIELEGDGCFAATHRFRFVENVTLNKTEINAFVNLLDMMYLLGPVNGRQAANKQVLLSKALAKGLTDSARQKILAFFDGLS